MSTFSSDQNTYKAVLLLICSAFLFSLMGVCIRYASHTVDNPTIVFFRNCIGLIIFLPFIFKQGFKFVKTEKQMFAELVEQEDPDLLDWFMEVAEPPRPELKDFIRKLKYYVHGS